MYTRLDMKIFWFLFLDLNLQSCNFFLVQKPRHTEGQGLIDKMFYVYSTSMKHIIQKKQKRFVWLQVKEDN